MGPTSWPACALGFQLWRCIELDALALQMALAARQLPKAICKDKVMIKTEAVATTNPLKLYAIEKVDSLSCKHLQWVHGISMFSKRAVSCQTAICFNH